MLVVTIRFLNGAYHATPWGKHVNEGVPEWPPSVWRLVRAIISVWRGTIPELEERVVWPIVQKMVAELPRYNLPDAQVSHTRHYMPLAKKRALVLATFVTTGDRPVHVIWPNVSLDEEEMDTLNRILANMHYFGRAESWCTASASSMPQTYNCGPAHESDAPSDADLVNVLIPKHNIKFYDINEPAKIGNDLDHIGVTTLALQKSNFVDPPGGRWVQYSRPRNCFEEQQHPHGPIARRSKVTLMRYAVVGPVRPSIKDTLRIGDMARAACMSQYGRAHNGETSEILSGKDAEGRPLRNHQHASYLPTYETQSSEIDHLTILAPKGFEKKDLDALLSLRTLYRYGLDRVSLVFQGLGTMEDFRTIPIMRIAKNWISATPLILTRHVKYRKGGSGELYMVDGPEDQIRAEIKNRYGDSYRLKSVILNDRPERLHNTNVRPFHFFRRRRRGSIGDGRLYEARLEFEESVPGPITLGYASHYGLGMFVPAGGLAGE